MDVAVEVTVDNRIVWPAIGDWHLVPPGEDIGEITERLDWKLGVQVPVAGPTGLLKRRVRLGVLVGVGGFSLGASMAEDSFGICCTRKYFVKLLVFKTHKKM